MQRINVTTEIKEKKTKVQSSFTVLSTITVSIHNYRMRNGELKKIKVYNGTTNYYIVILLTLHYCDL